MVSGCMAESITCSLSVIMTALVFLPQVAPEQGWDLATTLSYLSQKAGLPPEAWREGAEFETFQADVFHE